MTTATLTADVLAQHMAACFCAGDSDGMAALEALARAVGLAVGLHAFTLACYAHVAQQGETMPVAMQERLTRHVLERAQVMLGTDELVATLRQVEEETAQEAMQEQRLIEEMLEGVDLGDLGMAA